MNVLLCVLPIFLSQLVLLWGCSSLPTAIVVAIIVPIVGLGLYICGTELLLIYQDHHRVDILDKSVIITGCDSGFGFMLAKTLSKKGMFVFAGVLNDSSDGAEILKTISGVKVIQMDITSEEEVKNARNVVVEELSRNNKRLHAVVNNAGIAYTQFLEFTAVSELHKMFDVNTFGMLRVSQMFAPLLRGCGRFVNVTSIAGIYSWPLAGGYTMTKFASEGLSKSLRLELHPLGVGVITIQPFGYRTEILLNAKYIHSLEEEAAYSKECLSVLEKRFSDLLKDTNPNILEVIECMESAILNKFFQYNYIPGFWNRMTELAWQMLTETFRVKTGFFGFIPRTMK